MNRRSRLVVAAIILAALASLGASAARGPVAGLVMGWTAATRPAPAQPADPGPAPGPICKPDEGEHCGSCFVLRPGHPWERACCTPGVEGGVTFVPAPFECPAAPPPPSSSGTSTCGPVILANDSTTERCSRLGVADGGGRFLVAVQQALEDLDPPDPYPQDETTLYTALAPLLAQQGLCVGMYAEE